MSHLPPTHPQMRFSFPQQTSYPQQVLQRVPVPDGFGQLPDANNFTNLQNNSNSVSQAAAAAWLRAQSLQSPQQPTASTPDPHVQQAERDELIRIFQKCPPEQVEQLFELLRATALPMSSPASDSSSTVSQPSASLSSDLSQTTAVPSTPHLAGQGPIPTLTTPSIPNSTDDVLTPAAPSATSLGKRRMRSDSTGQEEDRENAVSNTSSHKAAQSKPTKVLSNMDPPPVPAPVVPASHTLSSFVNIPPPDGPETASPQTATASNETRPAKRARKRKSTQASESPVPDMSAMQTVFRASATGFPAQNNNRPGQAQWPSPLVQQPQQIPSCSPQGAAVFANGEHAMSQTQNAALGPQSRYHPSRYHPSQQSTSTPVASSPAKLPKCLPPLEIDEYGLFRLNIAMQTLTQTGNLRVLYPLLCYRPVQELMTYLLTQNMCAVRSTPLPFVPTSSPSISADVPTPFVPNPSTPTPSVPTPSATTPSVPAPSVPTPSSQASDVNHVRSIPRARYHIPSDDKVTVRISQKVRNFVPPSAIGQNRVQMIPQNVAGNQLSGAAVPAADLATHGRSSTVLPDVEVQQVPQIPDTDAGHIHDDGSSTAGQGEIAQPEVEAHRPSAEQNPPAPNNCEVTNGDNTFDFSDMTWADLFAAAGMQDLSQFQESADLSSNVGPQSTPLNVEGSEYTVVGEATGKEQDTNTPGASEMHTPASVGVGTVDVAGRDNESPSKSATNTSDLTQNPTSESINLHQGQGLSPDSSYTQEINHALYGDDKCPPPLPFPMFFGGNSDIDPDFFSAMGQQESSYSATSEIPTEPAEFNFEECINSDL